MGNPVLADEVRDLVVGRRETGSAECVIVKPSWHTSTGRSTWASSARRGAMIVRSYASCAFSANSWITPESRISIESE